MSAKKNLKRQKSINEFLLAATIIGIAVLVLGNTLTTKAPQIAPHKDTITALCSPAATT